MDEPCSALDPIATAKIEELIDELRASYSHPFDATGSAGIAKNGLSDRVRGDGRYFHRTAG